MKAIITILFSVAILSACATLSEDQGGKAEEKAPRITDDMALEEAIGHGLKFGGETLTSVKKRIAQQKEWPQTQRFLTSVLTKQLDQMSDAQVANAVHLYQITSRETTHEIVQAMIISDRAVVRQIGWQLAARNPSRPVAAVIERELTRAVWDGEEQKVLIPEMAQAVQANQIRSVYTLLRQGLMSLGAEDFAKAMIDIEPDKATFDFMTYLAQATIEDLRQLNQDSVNLYSCMAIFRFYLNHPLPFAHPNFNQVFFYAVSRNQMLAEMAQAVLEKQLAGNRNQLAFSLARLPVWIQVAYVEGNKANPNPNVSLFLDELKRQTAHKEVVEEIDARR